MAAFFAEDAELIALLKADSQLAFERIYDQYWQQLYRIAYNRLKSKELCEEIVQDVFTSLWNKRAELHIHSSLSAYLSSAIKYAVLDQIRKSVIRDQYAVEIAATALSAPNTTEEEVAFTFLETKYRQELNSLPEQRRLIFELSREEYLSNKEIALQLGIAPKTVENQIGKALKTLRVGLRDFLPTFLLLFLLG